MNHHIADVKYARQRLQHSQLQLQPQSLARTRSCSSLPNPASTNDRMQGDIASCAASSMFSSPTTDINIIPVVPVKSQETGTHTGTNSSTDKTSYGRRADHKIISVRKLLQQSGRVQQTSLKKQHLPNQQLEIDENHTMNGHSTDMLSLDSMGRISVLEAEVLQLRMQLHSSSEEISLLQGKLMGYTSHTCVAVNNTVSPLATVQEYIPNSMSNGLPPHSSHIDASDKQLDVLNGVHGVGIIDPIIQANLEPNISTQLKDTQKRLLDMEGRILELSQGKSILQQENSNLSRQIQEMTNNNALAATNPLPSKGIPLDSQLGQFEARLAEMQANLLTAHEVIDAQHCKLESVLLQMDQSQTSRMFSDSSNGEKPESPLYSAAIQETNHYSQDDAVSPSKTKISQDKTDSLIRDVLHTISEVSTVCADSSHNATGIRSEKLKELGLRFSNFSNYHKQLLIVLDSTTGQLQSQVKANAEIKRLVVQSSIAEGAADNTDTDTDTDIHQLTSQFLESANAVADNLSLRLSPPATRSNRRLLSGTTKRAILASNTARQAFIAAATNPNPDPVQCNTLRDEWSRLKAAATQLKRADSRKQWVKHADNLDRAVSDGRTDLVFAAARAMSGNSSRSAAVTPLYNSDGIVQYDPTSILRVMQGHYGSLAADTTGHSLDLQYWHDRQPIQASPIHRPSGNS
ncbi:hypothetical protein BASA81_014814 [Batrachochytrium salamandrivorans]|nr:hypothetical protein BASA81_014814 [Batrachochytrium salamandrivorans]